MQMHHKKCIQYKRETFLFAAVTMTMTIGEYRGKDETPFRILDLCISWLVGWCACVCVCLGIISLSLTACMQIKEHLRKRKKNCTVKGERRRPKRVWQKQKGLWENFSMHQHLSLCNAMHNTEYWLLLLLDFY